MPSVWPCINEDWCHWSRNYILLSNLEPLHEWWEITCKVSKSWWLIKYGCPFHISNLGVLYGHIGRFMMCFLESNKYCTWNEHMSWQSIQDSPTKIPEWTTTIEYWKKFIKDVRHKSLPTFRSVVLVHISPCIGGVPQSTHDNSSA
jgi:hypothetical protein